MSLEGCLALLFPVEHVRVQCQPEQTCEQTLLQQIPGLQVHSDHEGVSWNGWDLEKLISDVARFRCFSK